MLRLGITRSADQLGHLKETAAAREVEIIPMELIKVEPVKFEWPTELDNRRIDWILFTSANGVEAFFGRLSELDRKLSQQTRIAAVGRKTNSALIKHGRSADFVPMEALGKVLFNEFVDMIETGKSTVIYARAETVTCDPQQLFESRGIDYNSIICYRSRETELDTDAAQQFTDNDYILFTAPSTVTAYQRQFGKPTAKLIAIGPTTASAMNRIGWPQHKIMKEADIDHVLEYLTWK